MIRSPLAQPGGADLRTDLPGYRIYRKASWLSSVATSEISGGMGFCLRAKLPEGTTVPSAPSENPSKPMSESEFVADLERKGLRLWREQ